MGIIKINGTREINGKEVEVIEGGFGENQKILLVKTIAEIHSLEVKYINKQINANRKRFKDNIDIIDLKTSSFGEPVLETLFTKAQIGNAKNIYALSERGYSKLIKIMDTDLAWDIHDELMDNYFNMRQVINSNEQLKANLLLSIYNGGQEGVLASKQLTEIEVKEATTPLLKKIEEDKPLVGFAETIIKSNDNILVRELAKIISDEIIKIGQNKLYELLRKWNYIMQKSTEPYQKSIDNGYFVVEEKAINTPYGAKITKTTKVTPKGQVVIVERFRKECDKVS